MKLLADLLQNCHPAREKGLCLLFLFYPRLFQWRIWPRTPYKASIPSTAPSTINNPAAWHSRSTLNTNSHEQKKKIEQKGEQRQQESESLSGAPQRRASDSAGGKQEADEVLRKMICKSVPFLWYYNKDELPTHYFGPKMGQETLVLRDCYGLEKRVCLHHINSAHQRDRRRS